MQLNYVSMHDKPHATRPSAGRRVYRVREARRASADPARKDSTTTVVKKIVEIKKWEIDAQAFSAWLILSDGTHAPALQLRELFEEYDWHVSAQPRRECGLSLPAGKRLQA